MYAIECKTEGCDFYDDFLGTYNKLQEKLTNKCPDCDNVSLFQSIEKMSFKLVGDGWADSNYKQIVEKVKKPIKGLDD